MTTTTNKDFKVKHGLDVANGGTFGGAVSVGTPTEPAHAITLEYLNGLSFSGSATTSDVPPESPGVGDLWFDTTSGAIFLYYDAYWVQIMSATGPQGPTGDTGAVGPANSLTVGTVTTGAAGSNATITLTGTAPNQVFNASIPQGIQGIKGDKGDKGDQGIQGIQGEQGIQGIQGETGLQGIQGIQGEPGTTLYSELTGTPDLSVYQTKVSGVSDTEIGYLDGVTSAIQTQLDGKVSTTGTNTISLTTTTESDPLTIQSKNLHGGTGFAGLITFENTTTGATNTKKYLRMNGSGGIEIINNAYTANIFTLEDNGNLTGLNNVTANGTVSATNIGDSGWQTVSSFSNSYSGTNVAYRKINNVVYLRGRISGGTANAGAFTLPSGYRPSTVEAVIPVQQYGTANINYITIGTDGVVVPNGSSAWLASVVFPVG